MSFTEGDPLGPSQPPAAPPPGYGAGPVPPGAYAPPPAPAPGGPMVLAGWFKRVGAAIIDGLIVGAVVLVLFLPLAAVGLSVDTEVGAVAFVLTLLLFTLLLFVASMLYAPFWMARTNGQTIGKQVLGIRVVRTNGKRVDFGHAALREVAIKALLFGVGGSLTFGLANLLDWLWPLWDDENRALHDFLASTRVVEA